MNNDLLHPLTDGENELLLNHAFTARSCQFVNYACRGRLGGAEEDKSISVGGFLKLVSVYVLLIIFLQLDCCIYMIFGI